MCNFSFLGFFLYSFLPQYLYCVGGDVKHCSLTQSWSLDSGIYILGNCDMCPVCIANATVIDSDC